MSNNIKVIEIDGKQVEFKVTAATPLRYKEQFGKDYFQELSKLRILQKTLKSKKSDSEKLANVDFELFYNIAWVFAKTANKSISEPIEWLDGFNVFPMAEIIPQLQELIAISI
ncbi:hypothetical protein [Clostridium beijerinckii]|uniref:Prophage pi2 protein 40 n=1 Tax=Clostridium beijerinckii TaxID=1520 RepID=A0AAW3W8R3_CLOBE|nr:hypothetical protein [Clostridium beijerinckii]MBC2458156.1 hypothetical protein [Clostridium beijerinckii]MBC2475359.1 hypothetical protein [Clostridium beijerinckii]NOV62577.1 hypothetical protein [Clostridium beijerinckii]NOV70462.1 hypothetical protein [Clostridium beijerinckii]NOW30629.1 hypothetical protein [Clostridium beijerinckii]